MAGEALRRRIEDVLDRIRAAAERAGRDPAGIRLVAVSKTRTADEVRAAAEAGLRDFGENYAQELARKRDALGDLPDLRWHMIGHLQRNKAKLLVPGVHMIQTVDSIRLVEALDRRLADAGATLDVMIQVDVGDEATKSGVDPAGAADLVRAVRSAGTLRLRGLMAIPPLVDDPEEARPHFRALRSLADSLGLGGDERGLSMGMSDTYETAVEEGATLVRVGSSIFGPRA